MAIAILPNAIRLTARGLAGDVTGFTLNGAGQRGFTIGHIHLPGQTGSKTISAAGGGAILWNSASGNVLANAGTTVRLGIGDLDASGLFDGTFDVSADFVGGTDTIANNALFNTPMEAGSKTVSHGQKVAIGFEMISRGGTDAFSMNRILTTSEGTGVPYSAGASNKATSVVPFLIKFDDGTYGWIADAELLRNTTTDGASSQAFNSGSSPDEYAAVFTVNAPMRITRIGLGLQDIGSADTFEMILYSDPSGTPVAEFTDAPDPDALVNTNMVSVVLDTPFDLEPGVEYAIALRATAGTNVGFSFFDLGSGFQVLKAAQPFSTLKMAGRTNQSGAFVETQAYHLPDVFLWVAGFEDGAGGSPPDPEVHALGARIFSGF